MYAVGTSSKLGYHDTRMCFELKNFPPCASKNDGSSKSGGSSAKRESGGGSTIFDKYISNGASKGSDEYATSAEAETEVEISASSTKSFAISGFVSIGFT